MEFDDFFGDKQQYRKFDHDHRSQDNLCRSQNFKHPYQRHNSNYKWKFFLEKLKNNRKLQVFVLFTVFVILAITITLIIILLPLILKLLNYISQNGVQGILDNVSGFLDKLWKGKG